MTDVVSTWLLGLLGVAYLAFSAWIVFELRLLRAEASSQLRELNTRMATFVLNADHREDVATLVHRIESIEHRLNARGSTIV